MRKSAIYAWMCPHTGRPVYVGKTSQPVGDRMRSHLRMARKGDTSPKYAWLRENTDARAIVIEETTVEASGAAERRWQRRLARFGLLNVATAGSGNPGIGRVAWSAEIDALLGKAPDSEIAQRLGCHRKTVSHRRKCLGIPASFDRSKNVLPPAMGGWNRKALADGIIARLGDEPDHVLAKEAGVPSSAAN